MKILLVGDLLFLSQKLCNRLIMENDTVYHIGMTKSVIPGKIKHFSFNPSDDKCTSIFEIYRPDLVIYCCNTQQDYLKSMTSQQLTNHVSGFFNIFKLSNNYNVQRFVYISTSSLYEDSIDYPDENSPIAVHSLFQECHYICEQHILTSEANVFQTSIIVRPSIIITNDKKNKSGIIDYFMQSTIAKAHLGKAYNFIHINDFTNFIVNIKSFTTKDIINLGSDTSIDGNNLMAMIKPRINVPMSSIHIESTSSINIQHSKDEYDYRPVNDIVTSLQSMIKKRNLYYKLNSEIDLRKILNKLFNKKLFKNEKLRVAIRYIETIIIFALLVLLTIVYKKPMANQYIDIRILYIAIIGLVYGIRQSSIAAILCIGLALYKYIANEYGIITAIYDIDIITTVIVYISTAMLTGYLRDRSHKNAEILRNKNIRVKDQLEYTREMYNESMALKEILRQQIFNTTDSYGKIFSTVEQLDSLHFDRLKTEIILVTEEIMRNNSIALYMTGKNTNFLRLLSSSHEIAHIDKSIALDKSEIFKSVSTDKTMYINQLIDNKESPTMIAPIISEDKVIAMLVLYDAPLDVLTLGYENLFRITSRLVNQAIIRAYSYEQAQEDKLYLEDTQILTAENFKLKLQHAKDIYDNEHGSYVLLEVGDGSQDNVMKESVNYIREFDYVGIDDAGNVNILLHNISKNNLDNVIDRLANNNIHSNILDETY